MASSIPGEFVPLDVNYSHDRAIREAGPLAELLFVRGMAYCRRVKSYGHVPEYDLPVVGVGIPNPKKHARTLTKVGLWQGVDDGFVVRSWAKWNPSSTKETREKQSTGGALGNHNRWHVNGVTSEDCAHCPSVPDRYTDRSPDHSPIGMERSVSDRLAIAEVEVDKDSSSEVADAPIRPDVLSLIEHLDRRIAENGSKLPSRSKKNLDAARLLMDRDGRTVEQVRAAIDWCQGDDFWRSNILSMSKLREKYDQIRLAALRPGVEPQPTPGTSFWDRKVTHD